MNIIPLKKDHLEDAAKLARNCYQILRKQIPLLPISYSDESAFIPLLENIINAECPGVAAVQNGKLIGFFTGWQMQSFRGEKSIYSPEWANAAEGTESQHIYEGMYSQLAEIWAAENYGAHYISLFANDTETLRTLHWLGFGMISVDAIRELDSIPKDNSGISIRQAEVADLQLVVDLHEDLRSYMKKAPIHLPTEKKDKGFFQDWIEDPSRLVWLGYQDDEPAAFLRSGPADDDVCTIIIDEETTSIYAAYTIEDVRDKGFGAALLDQHLANARASGYSRCAVTFEPMNLIGTQFWLKYFKPVCYSVLRHIDRRLIKT